MELIEKLREILKTDYGIASDADLESELEKCTGPDLGIFVTPLEEVMSHAS